MDQSVGRAAKWLSEVVAVLKEETVLSIQAEVNAAVAAIRQAYAGTPKIGIILGTGLGDLAREIKPTASLAYEQIPHFPKSTATSHAGQLVCGELDGIAVVAMEGRLHAYEGYTHQQITFPVRVMKALGAEVLVVSNACGGMNPNFRCGDLMIIDDHINLMNGNPLIGVNDDRLGPRFPDMSRPYDPQLVETALQVARKENIVAHRGIYVAVTGPNLETRAEYRFLRLIGADVVGMSTVPEVLVANHAGMRVLGLSIVTDMCLPDALEPADVPRIIAIAKEAEPKLRTVVRKTLQQVFG